MITSEPILFDTNVLVYNQIVESKYYNEASLYHQKVFTGEIKGVLSAQNLLEFSVVMINPKKIIIPLTQKAVACEVDKYLNNEYFDLIYPDSKTLVIYTALLKKYRLSDPRQAFDLFLASTMLANGIKTILTANNKDFAYGEINAIKLLTRGS